MDTDPTFDADKFLEGNEQYDEYMKKTYAYYPPYDSDSLIKAAIAPKVDDIETIFDSSTILHQYLKCNKLCINGEYYKYNNATAAILINNRREVTQTSWLSWDYMQLLMNLFLRDRSYDDDIAIIPAGVYYYCVLARRCREEANAYDNSDDTTVFQNS